MKELHEYAKLLPPLEGADYEALCQDVKARGLMNPIVLKDGKILDGRNRARVCEDTGVTPRYENFNGGDALAYVISQNLRRRHLGLNQRAVLALDLEKRFASEIALDPASKPGRKKIGSINRADTRGKKERSAAGRAAEALQVSIDLVYHAKRLAKHYPEKLQAVRNGALSVTEALIEGLGDRARVAAIKEQSKQRLERLNKHNRQVGDFLDAMRDATKAYVAALKVAEDSTERFSAEAVKFTIRRLNQVRKLQDEFEAALNKK